jgi:hypothetical protein
MEIIRQIGKLATSASELFPGTTPDTIAPPKPSAREMLAAAGSFAEEIFKKGGIFSKKHSFIKELL